MSWLLAKPTGERLLAGVPEGSQESAATTSQPHPGSMESMQIGAPVAQASPLSTISSRRSVPYRKVRLAFTLGLHLLGFAANIAVLVTFCIAEEWHFLPALVVLWLVNAGVCTWVAWRDPDITFLACLGNARLPFLFLVYGVLQYIQVKHICDVYWRRLDAKEGATVRTRFHAKTFDGIIGGIPFACLCLWSYFLIDADLKTCNWYMYKHFADGTHHKFRYLYCAAGWMSIVTLSMGIIEVDYRVSEHVRDAIDSSVKLTFLQWSYRFTEAGSRICSIVLLCVVMEPLLLDVNENIGTWLMPLYPLVWFIVYYLILATSRTKGTKRDQVLAHVIMAIVMWFTNPFRFVDSPSFIKPARHINSALWAARIMEFGVVVMVLAFAAVGKKEFPESCHLDTHVEVVRHIVEKQPFLIVMWALMVFLHGAVFAFHSSTLFHGAGLPTDETVLDMIPAQGESDGAAVAVRPTVARGIASHVLRVGTGITSQIFAEEEQAFGNFVIEKVLGRGAYGVVVMVRMRSKKKKGGGAGGSVDPSQDVVYAMKLQNTYSRKAKGTAAGILPTREMTADREREIMRKLDHPFIIRLAYFFEVPDRVLKDASSGDIIMDGNKNNRFHKAIVMEFCPGGDLDGFVCKKAFNPGYVPFNPANSLDESAAKWLQLTRRLAAEMCVALAFLHERDIVYRDLKPQNVLLKTGADNDVHICYTDFGFSKDVSGTVSQAGTVLDSLAGSPLYAAPEVMAIATRQARAEYTPAVDLYSLGRTISVLFWRVLIVKTPNPELKMPSHEDMSADSRIHEHALALIKQLTSKTPAKRGKAADLEGATFFQKITLETGQELAALTWAGLENAAS